MLLHWLLPSILVVGILTSYSDLKEKRIANKVLLFGILYVFFLYHYFYLFNNIYELTAMHLYALLFNGGIALAGGFLLWYLRFWTAGDAKLFFTYSLMVPPSLSFGNPVITVVDLLINTFVPLGIYLVFRAIESTSTKDKIDQCRTMLNLRRLSTIVLFVFVLMWPLSLLETTVPAQILFFCFVLVLLVLSQKISQFHSNKMLLFLSVVACLRFLFDPAIISLSNWFQFLLFLFVFVLIVVFLNGISFTAFTKKVALSKLKKGMVPAEIVVKKGKTYSLKRAFYGLKQPFLQNALYQATPSGFTTKDIKAITSAKKLPFKEIRIQETMSFAPFLFLGILLQVFLDTNVIGLFAVMLSLI